MRRLCHEREGGAVFSGIKPKRLATAEKRGALRNLAYANPGGFERLLASELYEGLQALEWGRPTRLLQPIKSRLHGGLREIGYRLGAICFVEHERGRGQKKSNAQETAANEFDVDIEAVRNWEKRLPKELGELEVARRLKFAYNVGTQARADPEYQALVNYGLENLQFCAREYKAMRKERALKRSKKRKASLLRTFDKA